MNCLSRHPVAFIAATITTVMLLSGSLAGPLRAQTVVVPRTQESAHTSTDGMQTVGAVAIAGYNNLIADLNFLGGLAGRPEVGQMVEGFAALFTQGKGLAGLDKTKPWGVLLQTDGSQFKPIACLPINNAPDLLSLLEAFQINVEDVGNDVMEIQIPEKPSVYIRSAGGWAFLSNDMAYLQELPADPSREMSPMLAQYDFAARLDAQKIPEEYRQLAIHALQAGVEEGLEREEDEDEQAYELRKQWSKDAAAKIVSTINEVDQVTIGWSLDAQQQQTYLDMTTTYLPDGTFSRQLADAAANGQTNYAGFYQPDAAVSLTFIQKSDPELMQDQIEQFKMMMLTARKQIAKDVDEQGDELAKDPAVREAMKQALNDWLDVVEATIESGHLEGGAIISVEPNGMTLVAGGHCLEPQKIENGLRAVVEAAKEEPDFPGINWNADTHAGVTFHTAQLPVDEDEEDARKLFGPTVDVALGIGIGNNSVYFALGRDPMPAAKRVIDESLRQPNKPVPASELMLSLGQFMDFAVELADEEDRASTKMIADMLRNEAQGRDHIRGVYQVIDNGQRFRLVVEEGVLRALGKYAEAAAQAASAEGF